MGRRGDVVQAEVMDALRANGGRLTAYDILASLKETNPKAAPTTVYRALNALMDQGLVHRLESLNAFVVCKSDHACHDAILSICDDCGTVEETVDPDVLRTMAKAVGKTGFAPKRHVVEVHGTCSDCTPDKSDA